MATILRVLSRRRADCCRKVAVGYTRTLWSYSRKTPPDFAERRVERVIERCMCSSSVEEEVVLFVMPRLRALQLISRFKIVHVGLMGASALPVIDSYVKNNPLLLEQFQLIFAIGSIFTLLSLMLASVYISRVIGQILYYPKDKEILITTVSFWGNQVDRRYSVNRIVPWGDTCGGGISPGTARLFHRMEIIGCKDPFYYCLKWGMLKNLPLLSRLLYLPEDLGGEKDKIWSDAYKRAAKSSETSHRKRQ